ncbi:MAG: rhamnulokinase family protein [Gemmatales bacterium]|nr:rhamnulokinase [Gemmatales bacterium]MDW8175880.1 rhamnulokinase family protein [Gemmatales bacterium]
MAGRMLAFDLGAESGRAVLGEWDGQRLHTQVAHRFPNGPVRLPDGMYWDALRLFEEIKAGLRLAREQAGQLDSVGVDTWGVDFALLGRGDILLGNPRHYRDPHTEGIFDYAFARVSREEIFHATGIQFMRLNTLFQLLALQRNRSPILEAAETLIMMPDLFHFWLSGRKVVELTNASTTQMYDPVARNWAKPMLDKLALSTRLLLPITPPGTVLGSLLPQVAEETNCHNLRIVVPATHDTASAVAAVPGQGNDWCYISSGTWSLVGVETSQPVIDARTLAYNFTNEIGYGHRVRLLKNVMGLWLVQECRRSWERAGQSYSYEELTRFAEAAPPRTAFIEPDDPSFLLPISMPSAIAEYCRRTGQPVPDTPGTFVRVCLESLALKYRWVIERLEELLGKRLNTIHIVGGGAQNRLLNQLTADCCNRLVLAGPVEATSIGNLLVQMLGLGWLNNLEEARTVVRHSFPMERFEPRSPAVWDDAYSRFVSLLGQPLRQPAPM